MPPVDPNQRTLHELKQQLEQTIGTSRYNRWFGTSARFTIEGEALLLEVASPYLLNWIEQKYARTLKELAQSHLGPQFHVRTQVTTDQVVLSPAIDASLPAQDLPQAPSVARTTSPIRESASRPGKGRKLARLADFVTGACNELARAAALQVVQSPGETPVVYLQGGVGSGKTHLLEAVHRELRATGGTQSMLMGAEQFTSYFTQAMSARSTPSFRARFQNVDVLLIDDIDFLDAKRGTQDEFLHIVKRLQANGGQLVVAGNCHPKLLTRTSEELISRFQAGLVCRLEAPCEDVRRQIVVRHAERQRVTLSRGAIDFIVDRFRKNARELEGSVNILATWSRMTTKRVGTSTARELLGQLERDCLKIIRISDIEQVVCELFGISLDNIRGDSRKQTVSQPRMLAMYLARRLANVPYSEIGEHFGKRNHSTVMAAERKIEQQMVSGTEIRLGGETWKVSDLLRNLEDRVRVG